MLRNTARSGGGRALALWLWLAAGLLSSRAQAETEALFLVSPAAVGEQSESEALLQGYASRARVSLVSAVEPDPEDAAAESAPSELSVLRAVERALLEARELSADLREGAALRVLAAAEQELLSALALPGAHAFLAEIYLQLALCAAQREEEGLFESALSRALSLDPNRRIEAAEAPPAILERARTLARKRDLAPLGESRVESEPQGANVWLDGVRLGGDSAFRARAGVHVLVVRAPGHAPYSTLLSLEPGKRPALQIALSARPSELARRALVAARTPSARSERARALAQTAGKDVYLFELGAGFTRALVQRCEADGCGALEGFSSDGHDRAAFADRAQATTWLNARAMSAQVAAHTPTHAEKPVWKRWPLWAGAAALVVVGVATAVWVTRPNEPQATRSLEIDASALPR